MSRLVRSELRKLLSTRLWWGLLVGVTATSAALAVLQHRHLAHRVDGLAPGRAARLAVEQVDEFRLPGHAQRVEHEGDLEGVARLAERVQREHGSSAKGEARRD